ncbi:MAG TPA: exo-beta-N-acetylmuramidase NamZ domain-containing protein [Ignavibacteriaceae bacterium]
MKNFLLFGLISSMIAFWGCSSSTQLINISELEYPSDLQIVTRAEWGWQPLLNSLPQHKINKITIHHEGEEFPEGKDMIQYLRNLQNWSRSEKKWIDIPYHFMIDLNGNIYEARPINYPGDTNTEYDVRGHALICVVGNYETITIKESQLKALARLIAFLKIKYNVDYNDIKGHKDYSQQTVCPGKNLYKYIADGSLIEMVKAEVNKANESITSNVKTGIEVLRERNFDILKGKRVGLVTNPTGVDSKLKSTIDILFEAKEVNLTALYGPEHGVRGNYTAGDPVDFYVDEATKLPVYSLYGKTRKPNSDMLKNVDVLVFDIQDIGSRSYTYISTMGLVMEAAAENNKEVVILDRPNPLGGQRIEGNVVEDGYYSFVSQFAIPYVHGLTVGELAKLLNEEGLLTNKEKCKLTVVPMEGWTRDMYFEQTKLPWVLTSPHVPHKYSPFYYTLSGILGELRGVLSIGVGYTIPFQTFATEWINDEELSKKMNSYNLEGVIFRPITYQPYYGFGKDKMLHGVEVYITDYSNIKLIPIQFYFAQAINELYGRNIIAENEGRFDMFDKVLGTNKIRDLFMQRLKVDDILPYLNKDVENFRTISKKYYLYN